MPNEIISYIEMCQREGVSLQAGMNYRLGGDYSVILMSVRPNAPYQDAVVDDGQAIIYEGHDMPRSRAMADPKQVDQPLLTATGSLTQNGKFYLAAQQFKAGVRPAERVRVYEKIRQGIWSCNGSFCLVDAWTESDGKRQVVKYRLEAIADGEDMGISVQTLPFEPSRVIPTTVKLEVWQRDGGKCVMCGAMDELHFDHIIPFSKGGTSLKAENIQLLCARHNLEKRDRIE